MEKADKELIEKLIDTKKIRSLTRKNKSSAGMYPAPTGTSE